MAIDLFSVVLSSAVGWVVHKTLDSVSECVCGSSYSSGVTSQSFNQIQCPKCHNDVNQYLNVTNHTVASNGAVIAAHVSNQRGKIPYFRNGILEWHFDIDIVNSKYEQLVMDFKISIFRGQEIFSKELILSPKHERSHWKDMVIEIPKNLGPSEGSATFSVDTLLYNTWGELLYKHRLLRSAD